MKKYFLLSVLSLFLLSCGKTNERLLTTATGSIYECLLVGNGSVRSLVAQTMSGDMYGLPQMEPYFTVTQVQSSQFDDFLKSTRNILLLDINPNKYTQLKVLKSRDLWSKPQAVIRIQSPSEEALESYWEAYGDGVRDWFVREEIARQIRFYRANTNKEARAQLKNQGLDLLIPEDFILVKSEEVIVNSAPIDVLWCCNNKGPMRKDVIVYSYPYTSQEQFSTDSIVTMRNAVLGQLVSAQVPGSHMGTEYKHFPPVSRSVSALRDTIGGFYAIETRGLWKIVDGEAMGGPFVSLTRLDQVNGRVVTAETFLFAAGQKKRNAMRQLEAILYTLKMPNEKD